MTNPLLFVSFPQKDGRFQKIWSPSNCHNFLDGDQSFFNCHKRGHATCFFENLLTTLDENFPKNMTTPLFWRLKQFNRHSKNSDGRMATNNFCLPHLVPFWSPPYGDWKILVTTRMGNWRNLVGPLCGDQIIFGCKRCGDQNFFNHLSLWRLKLFGFHKKGGVSYVFGKPSLWRPKIFSHHWTLTIFWMVIKKIQLPSNTPPPLDGDEEYLIIEKVVGMCYHFGKTTLAFLFGWLKNFSCHLMVGACWMVTKKIWSPFT